MLLALFVMVAADMDAAAPGIQSQVTVPASQTVVEDVAIYIYDPLGERVVWGIGFIGGLDRGIAFGHVPSNRNAGMVAALAPAPGRPVNPGNTAELLSPAHQPAFPGPEVQYLEFGAAGPAVIRAEPDAPVFTVDVVLAGARPGDVFDFFLLDMVTVWSGGTHGAFSTRDGLSLDTGGDAVLDGTQSLYGVDPDPAIPVPPAAYLVDYVDGGNGPAVIRVAPVAAIDSPGAPSAAALVLHPARPDPFTAAAAIHFEVAAPGRVRLAVFDVTGRLVRPLLDGAALAPGAHAAAWDGRDAGGREAPAGVYFVRLEAGGDAAVRRAVRLR